jgi:hypothetical protein
MQWRIRGLLSVLVIGICGSALAAPQVGPDITSQGFAMETQQASSNPFGCASRPRSESQNC